MARGAPIKQRSVESHSLSPSDASEATGTRKKADPGTVGDRVEQPETGCTASRQA